MARREAPLLTPLSSLHLSYASMSSVQQENVRLTLYDMDANFPSVPGQPGCRFHPFLSALHASPTSSNVAANVDGLGLFLTAGDTGLEDLSVVWESSTVAAYYAKIKAKYTRVRRSCMLVSLRIDAASSVAVKQAVLLAHPLSALRHHSYLSCLRRWATLSAATTGVTHSSSGATCNWIPGLGATMKYGHTGPASLFYSFWRHCSRVTSSAGAGWGFQWSTLHSSVSGSRASVRWS